MTLPKHISEWLMCYHNAEGGITVFPDDGFESELAEKIQYEVQKAVEAERKEGDKHEDVWARQSEYYESVADAFLDACGGCEVFGEHSSGNDPYQNAIDYIRDSLSHKENA